MARAKRELADIRSRIGVLRQTYDEMEKITKMIKGTAA